MDRLRWLQSQQPRGLPQGPPPPCREAFSKALAPLGLILFICVLGGQRGGRALHGGTASFARAPEGLTLSASTTAVTSIPSTPEPIVVCEGSLVGARLAELRSPHFLSSSPHTRFLEEGGIGLLRVPALTPLLPPMSLGVSSLPSLGVGPSSVNEEFQ